MDIALAIEQLLPSAEYGGSTAGNDEVTYNALRWNDIRIQPTWVELQAAWSAYNSVKDKETNNASIYAELDRTDLKIIRALAEGDTVRIEACKVTQAKLRAQLM